MYETLINKSKSKNIENPVVYILLNNTDGIHFEQFEQRHSCRYVLPTNSNVPIKGTSHNSEKVRDCIERIKTKVQNF